MGCLWSTSLAILCLFPGGCGGEKGGAVPNQTLHNLLLLGGWQHTGEWTVRGEQWHSSRLVTCTINFIVHTCSLQVHVEDFIVSDHYVIQHVNYIKIFAVSRLMILGHRGGGEAILSKCRRVNLILRRLRMWLRPFGCMGIWGQD